jgi:uncharacterized protein
MADLENVRVVQEMFAAFGKGDLATVLATLDDDVEWRLDGAPEVPYAGKRRGKAEVADFFFILATELQFERFQLDDFIAEADKVVVLGTERQRVKATGKSADNDWAMVFTLRDGKIVKFRAYEDSFAVAKAHRRT